jgi:hypothetical protein
MIAEERKRRQDQAADQTKWARRWAKAAAREERGNKPLMKGDLEDFQLGLGVTAGVAMLWLFVILYFWR